MCNVHGEVNFSQKVFINGLNVGLTLQTGVKKTVDGVGTCWLSIKEKVLGAVVNKGDHADRLLRHEKNHLYWLPWIGCHCKRCFQLPTT